MTGEKVMYATAWKMHKDKIKEQEEAWNIDEELDEDFAPKDINGLFEEEFKDYRSLSFNLLREKVVVTEEGEVSQAHLNAIEKYADKLFSKVGIDVNFTRHFLDRVNDARNKKQITNAELVRLFKQTYAQHGKKIAKLGPDAEAVLNDIKTDVNMPFVLKWDAKNQELDMVAKTVMRKKNFKTPDQKLVVDGVELEEGFRDVVTATKLVNKYMNSGKEKDALEAIKFGWKWITNPTVRAIVVGVVKGLAEKEGMDWKETRDFIKKHTGVDVDDVRQDFKESVDKKTVKTIREAHINEVTSNDLPDFGDEDPYKDIQVRFVPYAVKIKGFPEFYLYSVSVSKVRSAIRLTLKRMDDIEYIERVTDAEVRGEYRQRAYNPGELRAKDDNLKVRQDAYYRESYGYGSDELVKAYKNATPGEELDEAAWVKKLIAKYFQQDKYEKAAQALILYHEKDKEAQKHNLDYNAAKLIDMAGSKLDGRILAQTAKKIMATEAVFYAKENGIPLHSVYRPHSDMYYEIFAVARELDILSEGADKYLLEDTDIGLFERYEGENVPLDIPLVENWIDEEKDVELGKPKRGGPKKFYVYVKNDKGNVIKVTFGDTSGLKAKINNKDAAKSFAARHQCDTKKDRTTPGYWACRLPMYAKELGLEGGGQYFW